MYRVTMGPKSRKDENDGGRDSLRSLAIACLAIAFDTGFCVQSVSVILHDIHPQYARLIKIVQR